jgi:DNA recombination protein RmuC
MEIILVAALIVVVIGSTILILGQIRKNKPDETKGFLLIQNQIGQLTQELNAKMQAQQDSMNTQLQAQQNSIQKQYGINTQLLQKVSESSTKTVQEVTEKLTKLDETNNRIVEFATQLQSLENILKNPKHRGILGEFFLEDLLGAVMPQGTYKMQYTFPSDGKIVDAALLLKDKIIPIDAKFSLETYNKIQGENDKERREALEREFKNDLKSRIDETSKYIRPEEGTTDFALMFIPAEGIFYNLLMYKVGTASVSSEDLINYAFKQHVVIVSPNTLFAYLQTILQALKALQVEESVKDVIKRVGLLGKHLVNYNEHMLKMGKHLGTTVSMYNHAGQEFRKIDRDVLKISGVEMESEQVMLEQPETEE